MALHMDAAPSFGRTSSEALADRTCRNPPASAMGASLVCSVGFTSRNASRVSSVSAPRDRYGSSGSTVFIMMIVAAWGTAPPLLPAKGTSTRPTCRAARRDLGPLFECGLNINSEPPCFFDALSIQEFLQRAPARAPLCQTQARSYAPAGRRNGLPERPAFASGGEDRRSPFLRANWHPCRRRSVETPGRVLQSLSMDLIVAIHPQISNHRSNDR